MKNLRWLEFLFPFVFLIFVCCPAQTFFPTIMNRIKIGTLNLNGARDVYKRATLFQLIKRNKIDVMMIQETHSDCANEIEWKKEWEGEIILSHKSAVSGGVAVLFQMNFLPISYEVENVVDGHLMIVKAQFEKLKLVFINVYAPTLGVNRVALLNKIDILLSNCRTEDYMFMGGDFNCTENYNLDRNHSEPHMASQRAIVKLSNAHDLCDIWKALNENEKQYTWAQTREKSISLARLDRFYCFKHQFNIVKSCDIKSVGFSDHSIVIVNGFIANIKSKSAYWHFNVSLLEDHVFKEVFCEFWKTFLMVSRWTFIKHFGVC